MPTYVSPIDDRTREALPAAPRLPSMAGAVVGLLDISKPKSTEFLDRVAELLTDRYGVGEVVRLKKPTPSRPAPPDVRSEAERCGAVLVALAD